MGALRPGLDCSLRSGPVPRPRGALLSLSSSVSGNTASPPGVQGSAPCGSVSGERLALLLLCPWPPGDRETFSPPGDGGGGWSRGEVRWAVAPGALSRRMVSDVMKRCPALGLAGPPGVGGPPQGQGGSPTGRVPCAGGGQFLKQDGRRQVLRARPALRCAGSPLLSSLQVRDSTCLWSRSLWSGQKQRHAGA